MRRVPPWARHASRSPEGEAPAPLAPGTLLGTYEILARIGGGGMGDVFKARDTRLGRLVAIKVLPPQSAASRDANARLEREARAIASLQHPHICALHDVGTSGGFTFLVMEYLEGETLASRLKRGMLPLDDAVTIAIGLAAAVAVAHDRGIIHRDLKPSNVFLTRDGPKLLDFGLAKLGSRTGVDGFDQDETSAPETRQGSILGTLHYLSPEQLKGGQVDHRTDIFGFGCLLYEIVSGNRAFNGDSSAAVISNVLQQPVPPLSESRSGIPAALDWVVARCLEKKPENRTQSIADVRQNLEFVREGLREPRHEATAQAKHRIRVATFGAVVAALVTVAAAILVFTQQARPLSQVHFSVPLPTGTAFWPGSRLAVSPDGRRLVFAAGDAKESLWVRELASSDSRRIPGTDGAAHPFWSPDGMRLGFFADSALKTFDFSDSPPRSLATVPNGAGATWNQDDVIVFSSMTAPLQRVSALGGPPTAVAASASAGVLLTRPQFLQDGTRFLYIETDPKGKQVVYIGSLDGTEPKRTALPPTVRLADNYAVFVREGALFGQPFDQRAVSLTGTATRLAPALAGLSPRFDVSGNVLAYQPTTAAYVSRLVWVDRRGKEAATVGEPAIYSNPTLSPDGRFIAVGIARESTRDIWVLDSTRGTATRLTTDPADDLNPTWSPDNESMLFTSDRRGERDIYHRSLVTGAKEEPVLTRRGPSNVESWSRGWVAFNTNDGATYDLWIMRSGEWKAEPLFTGPFNERDGAISPDGSWLAFVSDESGRFEVYVTTLPKVGRRWQVSVAGGVQPQWRRDSKELYYLEGNTLVAVDVEGSQNTFNAGQPVPLFARAWGSIIRRNLYVPDASGRRFLVHAPLAGATEAFDVVLSWTTALRR